MSEFAETTEQMANRIAAELAGGKGAKRLPRANEGEMHERKKRVSELYYRGVPRCEIANTLGLSVGQVSLAIRKLLEDLVPQQYADAEEARRDLLASHNRTKRAAWDRGELKTVLAADIERGKLLGLYESKGNLKVSGDIGMRVSEIVVERPA